MYIAEFCRMILCKEYKIFITPMPHNRFVTCALHRITYPHADESI